MAETTPTTTTANGQQSPVFVAPYAVPAATNGFFNAPSYPMAYPVPGTATTMAAPHGMQYYYPDPSYGMMLYPTNPTASTSTTNTASSQVKFINGMNGPNPAETKRKRPRATPSQLALLEESFAQNPLPNGETRNILAEKLGMTSRSVQVWFQNRRAKIKAEAKKAAAMEEQKDPNRIIPSPVPSTLDAISITNSSEAPSFINCLLDTTSQDSRNIPSPALSTPSSVSPVPFETTSESSLETKQVSPPVSITPPIIPTTRRGSSGSLTMSRSVSHHPYMSQIRVSGRRNLTDSVSGSPSMASTASTGYPLHRSTSASYIPPPFIPPVTDADVYSQSMPTTHGMVYPQGKKSLFSYTMTTSKNTPNAQHQPVQLEPFSTKMTMPDVMTNSLSSHTTEVDLELFLMEELPNTNEKTKNLSAN